ncbi:MAG TPA: hypothetical protein VJR92_08030 [Gemmatimonadaceae bacterium]|nr:hypothetical protein [Gemmatimonadaceae bacterium]
MILIATLLIAAAPSCDVPPQQAPLRRPYCDIDASGNIRGPGADVCEQVARRWHTLTGTRAIKGAIRLVDGASATSSVTAQEWVLEWRAPSAITDVKTRSDGFVANDAENIIPHEAGHNLFASYTIFFAGPQDYAGYGSIVPDWFDESPAVWLESAAMRTGRVRKVIGTTPSLHRLATMDHPGREAVVANALNPARRWRERTVAPPCPECTFLPDSVRDKYRVTDVGVDARGLPDTRVWYSATNPSNAETLEEREFYALSYLLLRFIHVRGGYAAVRELISRYREDSRPRVSVLVGLPGLPTSFDAFEREWIAFLANPPAEER